MTAHDPLCPEGHGEFLGTIPICACPILREARADERKPFRRLADGWNDEASRYRGYAVGSSNPVVHKSIAQTLDQCAGAIRAVGAGAPQGSRVEAGTETSVRPGAIGPDTHDPLCRQQYWEGGDCFDCRLIAKVRADERARLRARVEALPFNPEIGAGGYVLEHWVKRDDVLALLENNSQQLAGSESRVDPAGDTL